MINFKEWRKKEAIVEVGPYKIIIQDIGNGKIIISASSKEQIVDSKKEVKKVVDLSGLQDQKTTGLALSAPAMEPMDNRNSYLPSA
jgi:hypothetical protein